MTHVITPETRLNKVLDLHPQMVDHIVALNPHDFARLSNPLMRRLMAPRITLGRLAAMLHMPIDELLHHVVTHSGVVAVGALQSSLPQSPAERPGWIADASGTAVATVDLLPMDEALDSDPLPPVMAALKRLPPGGVVRIKHKWEPQPFYDMWTKLGGLEWFAEQKHPAEWWIWVQRVRYW